MSESPAVGQGCGARITPIRAAAASRFRKQTALEAADHYLFHGGGMGLEGTGIFFTAPSGGGKTTLACKLHRHARILSDEGIALGRSPRPERGFRMQTIPFSLRVIHRREESTPLHRILFLEKTDEPHLTPVAPPLAMRKLLEQIHLSDIGIHRMKQAMAFLKRLLEQIPACRFGYSLRHSSEEIKAMVSGPSGPGGWPPSTP
jgi:hypothetical protein